MVLVIALLLIWKPGMNPGGMNPGLGSLAYVMRGDLPVTVEETGEVKAEKSKVIANEISWPVVIKEVIPDGTIVKPGETIVQFECKELLDAIDRQELDVSGAENQYIQASKNLELKIQELANNVQRTEQNLLVARDYLRRYCEGQWPIRQGDAESEVNLAKVELTLAEDKLAFMLKANEDPELNSPYSKNEITSEELRVERRKQALDKANSERAMLKKYDHPRETKRLEWAVVEAQAALDRAKLQQATQQKSAEHNTETKKRQLEMKKKKLDELIEDREKLTVKAEGTGLVVYDLGRRARWLNVTVEVGEKIERRQQIMIIPDLTTLEVRTQVYEVVIDQVKPGLKAFINLDSRPGQVFTGTVRKVRALPDTQNRWLNPDVKYFRIRVKFDEGQDMEGIRPGGSATVELVLDRLVDVLYVPVAAVFSQQEKRYCWRVNSGKADRVTVQIGKMNSTDVEIRSGLNEGDCVLLSEPEGAVTDAAEPAGGT